MNKKLILLGLIFFLGCMQIARSQTNDAGAWLSASFEKKISRAFSFSLNPEIRLNENFTEVGMIFNDFSLDYSYRKFLKVGLKYRCAAKQNIDQSFQCSNKFFADITLLKKWDNWQTRWRLRIQESDMDLFTSENNNSRWYLRVRGELKYKWSSEFFLFGSSEIFCQLNENIGRPMYDQYRLILGVEYEWTNRNALKPFLLYQSELFHNNAQRDFVLGLQYKHTLR